MVTVTFDTLKLVDKLKAAGLPPEQAEAVVRVIAEAQDELATRKDIELAIELALSPIRTDLTLLKWMVGFVLAGIAFVLLRLYFLA